MSGASGCSADRFWVLGGRWVEDATYLSWPRVYGPYWDYQAAWTSAEALNATADPRVRYVVVADLPERGG